MDEKEIVKYFKSISSEDVAMVTKSFFKTNKGEYSYGDIFLGVKVPKIRESIKRFKDLGLDTLERLLRSKYHEIRHFALLYMVDIYAKTDDAQKNKIFDIYMNNTKHINNWDLVDCSAHHIVGAHLQNKDKNLLYKMARSTSMWDRRIAIVSTFYYIKQNDLDHTLELAKILLKDKEDLIHKAVGWMLREVGKKDPLKEKTFLDRFAKQMPRVMLRYAIERFEKKEKEFYMKP
jgi:3-methyladenine DNA glycosylase AlkD